MSDCMYCLGTGEQLCDSAGFCSFYEDCLVGEGPIDCPSCSECGGTGIAQPELFEGDEP